MKTSIKVALIVLLAVSPFSFMSAAPVSATVKSSVNVVVTVNAKDKAAVDAAVADLITALKAEIKVQGIDGVKSIAAQVMAYAKDADTAKALAKALSTAALMVAKELNEDLNGVAEDVADGIIQGTSGTFVGDAISSASDAALAIGGKDVADAINNAGNGGEAPEVVVSGGDAGSTPAVDLSVGTGVSN